MVSLFNEMLRTHYITDTADPSLEITGSFLVSPNTSTGVINKVCRFSHFRKIINRSFLDFESRVVRSNFC